MRSASHWKGESWMLAPVVFFRNQCICRAKSKMSCSLVSLALSEIILMKNCDDNSDIEQFILMEVLAAVCI